MFEKMNERIKNLTVIDIGLIKMSVFFATIFIIHLFPQLLNISYTVLVILVLALAVKPIYVVWLKK
ncbi:MAG: hypothetical protein NTY34_01940 [Candidatus Omnitrophica bacterium]|nr:hypothetical protein [Candidatus Omnitrophota bacterium]